MVAKISQGMSLNRMLNYNEDKVNKGVAVCIGAGNYPLDPERMGFGLKLEMMQRQADLNQRALLKAMHISLNFDPSENFLTTEKLNEIAAAYMGGIGFGEQPYLVYQHHDAGHPHIHIVTTTVNANGEHINTYMIGKRKSEPARKSIEQAFGLVKAEEQTKRQQFHLQPLPPRIAEYGKQETKKAIQNVLENVIAKYKFASLAELNAVLGLYNVRAERGDEDSRVFKRGGLLYRLLDVGGKPIGVPIKASSFYSAPTLKKLRGYFDKCGEKPASPKSRIRVAIDMAFRVSGTTLDKLKQKLAENGISVVLRRNEQGFIYGITYVDHASKWVLNGSELGKNYSAKAIRERCMMDRLAVNGVDIEKLRQVSHAIDLSTGEKFSGENGFFSLDSPSPGKFFSELLDCLFRVEYTPDYVPYELRQQRNKKKRKRKKPML